MPTEEKTPTKFDEFCRDVKLLSGEEITEAYRDEIGSHSCMTGPSFKRQRDVRFYAHHPTRIQLVLFPFERANGGYARALLWKLDDDTYMLDRVYTMCGLGKLIPRVRKWVKAQAVTTRWPRGIEEDYRALRDGSFVPLVTLPESRWGFPWMDSFAYFVRPKDVPRRSRKKVPTVFLTHAMVGRRPPEALANQQCWHTRGGEVTWGPREWWT